MKISTVLFDLDGTLLPMDLEEFSKYYLGLLAKKMAGMGFDPDKLMKALWDSVKAMYTNDGSVTNEDLFWKAFRKSYGEDVNMDTSMFDDFYTGEFHQAAVATSPTPDAAAVVNLLKENGIRVALATNPIFPATATLSRMKWAGFTPEDFEKYTSYETDRYCKPNPEYFRHFIADLGVEPEECLMVGNDAQEDLAAAQTGMKVFLLTDCLIDRKDTDISHIPHGTYADLRTYLEEHVL